MKFIKNFSPIAISLTALAKKGKKFIWGAKCEESFQTLNNCLTTAPILALP